MSIAKEISLDMLRGRLQYHPETGIFTWLSNFHKSKIGKNAGYLSKRGYVYIKIDGSKYHAARIAWVMTYGGIDPNMEIDHINRVKSDNRISNLRLVTGSENCNNRGTWLGEEEPRNYTKHKSGFQVQVKGKYIGLVRTEEEAQRLAKIISSDSQGLP